MKAEIFLKEHIRMCLWFRNQGFGCVHCSRYNKACLVVGGSFPDMIADLDLSDLKEYVSQVEKWSKEHPVKTRLMDFMEKYPNAKIECDGTPLVCCADLGYINSCQYDCCECWNTQLEDE